MSGPEIIPARVRLSSLTPGLYEQLARPDRSGPSMALAERFLIEIEASDGPTRMRLLMSVHAISRLPSEVVNPLLPPLPVLLGVVGGAMLLFLVGAVVAAILLTRKR